MMLFIVLAITFLTSEGCELPEQMTGNWDSTLTGWNDLSITNTTVDSLSADLKKLPFSCYAKNGTTFIIQSSLQEVANIQYHYYTCLDIVPSESNLDVISFRVLTEENPKHYNGTVLTFTTSQNKTFYDVCQKSLTKVPLQYSLLLRKGFEMNVGNNACPTTLHAEFAVNFTTANDYNRCPDGFNISGCDRSHLSFNYMNCSNDESFGSVNYTCLNIWEVDDVTYTAIYVPQSVNSEQSNAYQFACLEQTAGSDGQLLITKSAGVCGADNAVKLAATETLSCREATTVASVPTTPAGSSPAQISTSGSESSTAGSGNEGGDNSDNGSCPAVSIPGFFKLLVSATLCILAYSIL